MNEAMAVARQLAAQPPAALRQTKNLMKQAFSSEIARQIEIECQQFAEMLTGAEAREAFQAFTEKRTPDFSTFE